MGRERREGRVLQWGVREERDVYYSGRERREGRVFQWGVREESAVYYIGA